MSQTAKFLVTIPAGATGQWNFGGSNLSEMLDFYGFQAAVLGVYWDATVQSDMGGFTIEMGYARQPGSPGDLEADGTPILPVLPSNTGNPMVDANGSPVLPSVSVLRRNEWTPPE